MANTEVVTQNDAVQVYDPKNFAGTVPTLNKKQAEKSTGVSGNDRIPYLQIIQPGASLIEEGYKSGTLVIRKNSKDDTPIKLGEGFDAVLISTRGRAQYYDESTFNIEYEIAKQDGTTLTTVNYDKYVEASKDPSYKKGGSNATATNPYKAGLEVLMYIPEHECYATFFGSSVTAVLSMEANIVPFVDGKLAHFTVEKRENKPKGNEKKFSWYIPTSFPSDEYYEGDVEEDLFNHALKTWFNPQINEVDESAEVVAEDTLTER